MTTLPDRLSVDSLLGLERRKHEAFATQRRDLYVELPGYFEALDAQIDSPMPPLVITGASGCGKSALLANWSERCRREHPEVFILAYYLDAASGKDYGALVRYIMMEIAERYGITDPLPADEDLLDYGLQAWLASIRDERMVLIIDGVEKLEDLNRFDRMIYAFRPNVNVIVSMEEGALKNGLLMEEMRVLKLRPLSVRERQRIIEGVMRSSDRFSTERISGGVFSESTNNSPLYLRTVLMEQRAEQVEQYLAADSIDQLFNLQLAHLEERHGTDTVRVVLSLIWASRNGLSGTELLGLTRMRQENLAPLLYDLQYHLINRNGLLTFLHQQIHEAITSRYGIVAGIERKLHRRLAAYFTRQTMTPRRAEEEPWHWMHAHAWAELQRCVINLPMFLTLMINRGEEDLLRYWPRISQRSNPAEEYRQQLRSMYSRPDTTRIEYAVALEQVGRFLLTIDHYHDAIEVLAEALAVRRDLHGARAIECVGTMQLLARGYYHTSHMELAESLLREAIAIVETAGEINHAGVMMEMKYMKEAEELYREALTIRTKLSGRDHPDTIAMREKLKGIRA